MIICKENACLLISCMQKEFIPTLQNGQNLVDHCCWLVDLMGRLGVPVVVVNHAKLGEPLSCFLKFSGEIHSTEITSFSCLEDAPTQQLLRNIGKNQFLLAGAETHVSILQTAAALKEQQKDVFIVTDASATRQHCDHEVALSRLSSLGVSLITREMLFFESLRRSDGPDYLNLSLTFLDQRYLRL